MATPIEIKTLLKALQKEIYIVPKGNKYNFYTLQKDKLFRLNVTISKILETPMQTSKKLFYEALQRQIVDHKTLHEEALHECLLKLDKLRIIKAFGVHLIEL